MKMVNNEENIWYSFLINKKKHGKESKFEKIEKMIMKEFTAEKNVILNIKNSENHTEKCNKKTHYWHHE